MWERLGRAVPKRETLAQAQSSLSDLLERQPLVLGAVGLAIGATVAGALAKSSLEDGWVGDLSDSLKADLSTRAGAVSQSVREASDTLKAEFEDAGAEYVDRVKQAGRDAMDAVASGVFHRTKTPQRTAKSCGPGAATLALPAGACSRTTGARKAASPGRARISRKTIARGKPGCLGCTCQNRVLSFATLSTRRCGRSRRPAFPAPSVRERDTRWSNSGEIAPRECFRLFEN